MFSQLKELAISDGLMPGTIRLVDKWISGQCHYAEKRGEYMGIAVSPCGRIALSSWQRTIGVGNRRAHVMTPVFTFRKTQAAGDRYAILVEGYQWINMVCERLVVAGRDDSAAAQFRG